MIRPEKPFICPISRTFSFFFLSLPFFICLINMKADAKKEVNTLLSAIQKKKMLGKKLREEKAKRIQMAQDWLAFSKEKENEKLIETMENYQKIMLLKEELRAINLENASNIDKNTLEYQSLYNTKEDILDVVKNKEKKKDSLLYELETVLMMNNLNPVGLIIEFWYEEPETGDPFEAVYGIFYYNQLPEEALFEENSTARDILPCTIARIDGRGKVIEETTCYDDYFDFKTFYKKTGHIAIESEFLDEYEDQDQSH